MPELRGTDDVYRSLVEEADENWLMGLVAFAIVEEQRIEWRKHFRETKGEYPSAENMERWYLEQPNGVLLRAKGDAENALGLYAQDVREQFIEDERRDIEREMVISEIRHASRFWPQFGISVIAGTASAFLFAIILTGFALLISTDVSPIKILNDAMSTTSQQVESDNGNPPRE